MSTLHRRSAVSLPNCFSRRGVLAGAGAGLLTVALPRRARAAQESCRVGVIGHTGRGDYGHRLDRAWKDVTAAVVAVADANPGGLAKALKRHEGARGFPDYRRMLAAAKPDIVTVAPRWIDRHCDMVVAAAEAGARGIYLEKPMCRTLAEADRMVAACEKHAVKLAIAHQTRYSPKIAVIADMIASGTLGRTKKQWIPVTSAGPGTPEPLDRGGFHEGNVAAAKDLLSAIDNDRQPVSNIYHARTATEMIVAVFESHRLRRPVAFPLENRKNPLTMLKEG